MLGNGASNKPASQWDINDLRDLANAEPQESLYLEFKKPGEFLVNGIYSPDILAEELAETSSAFLNSDGGIILLGVQTNSVDPKTETLKPLDDWDDQNTFERRGISLSAFQIIDRVNGNLATLPFGVETKAIEVPLPTGKTTIFVVSVPASVTSAHQSTRSLRYYKRIAEGDQPMLDYEIRDVNNRRTGPLLQLRVDLRDPIGTQIRYSADKTGSLLTKDDGRLYLILTTRNVGRATAPVAKFDFGVPNNWGGIGEADWFKFTDIEQQMYSFTTVFLRSGISSLIPRRQREQNIAEQSVIWYRRRWPMSDIHDYPLWPSSETIVPLGVVELQAQTNGGEAVWLPWKISAEGMPDVRGAAFLNRDGPDMTVVNFESEDTDWAVGAVEDQRFNRLVQKYGAT